MKQRNLWYLLLLCLNISAYSIAGSSCCDRIIATIGVGNSPNGIAITPDNQYAYVANNNNDNVANTVSVLDICTNTLKTTITHASFDEPYTVTINKAGTKAYVTNSGGTTVSIVDIATNTVTGTITGFHLPSGLVIHPNGATAYVNNYGDAATNTSGNGTTVSVVNLTTNTITSTITVGLAPAGLAITPDGAFVYVINYQDGNPGTGTISVIRTSDNTVVKTITGFSGPFAIAITPDGRYAYVTNFGSNNFSPVGRTVSVVDLKTNTICATITVGTQPSGIAITPDGCFAYVTIYNTLYLGPNFTNLTPGPSAVKIIDVCTNKLLCPVITVGQSPAQIAISCNGRAYVTNYSSDNVSVVDICDSMWTQSR